VNILDISYFQLALSFLFIILLILVSAIRKIGKQKLIIIASLRMTVQLVAAGYLLTIVFENPSWYLTAATIMIMLFFAIINIFKRSINPISNKLKIIVAGSLILGSLFTVLFFIIIIVRVFPWYSPQYFIPISGMIIGNSMTGILLGLNKMSDDFIEKRDIIENSLMLGATAKQATNDIVNKSIETSLLPTLNSMLGMGIISLPGMMTGQILSGTLPTVAIKYQIGIMLAILGAITITVIIFVLLGYKTYFNNREQLVVETKFKKN